MVWSGKALARLQIFNWTKLFNAGCNYGLRPLLFLRMSTTFIADVHLGKLAKALRLLGFDTLYNNNAIPQQLLATAGEQQRVLLSRYAPFTKALGSLSFTITSANPTEQLQEVVTHFQLKNAIQPFTRCLVCNGPLKTVSKAVINHLLEPNTRAAFNEFWQCKNCQRIYWKGSHYERMLQLVQQFSVA